MLSDVFIRRPILASVCSLLIILAGAICCTAMPRRRSNRPLFASRLPVNER